MLIVWVKLLNALLQENIRWSNLGEDYKHNLRVIRHVDAHRRTSLGIDTFRIEIHPAHNERVDLFSVCFSPFNCP
ncbi:unnamed protein product [Gongylonema pulchrum]|uniref:Uncharacterized protein n=1 Tax=Gongylonema pulchrum TaxID=637853 RepID=A0A183E2Q7_9BILA|nr:unnamed protein product [Gongylonema pulchrum]